MAEKVTIGNAELWHGDCRELLPTLPRFDAVITDPPYGLGKKMQGGTWGAKPESKEMVVWDNAPPDVGFLLQLVEASGLAVFWPSNFRLARTSTFANALNARTTTCHWIRSHVHRVYMAGILSTTSSPPLSRITQYIPQNLQYNVANLPTKTPSTARQPCADSYHKNSGKHRRKDRNEN